MQRLEAAIGQLAQSIAKRTQGTLPTNTEENPRGQVKAINLEEAKQMSVKMEEPKGIAQEEKSDGHEDEESDSSNSMQEESDEEKSDILEEEEQGDVFHSWQWESEETTFGQEEEDETENSEPWSDDDGQTSTRDDEKSSGESEASEILHDEEDHDEQNKAQLRPNQKAASEGEESEETDILNKEEEEEEDGPHTSRWTMETIPSKLGDPGSFSIPCEFYNLFKCYGLIDLGASVNVMPYSIYEQLDLGALKKTNIRIELADSSVRTPRGLIDNVLMYVKNLIFPVNFIVLDMEAHPTIPIILGRPFLATSNAVINVRERKLKIGGGKERITIKMPRRVTRRNLIAGLFQVTSEEDSRNLMPREREDKAEEQEGKGRQRRTNFRSDSWKRKLEFGREDKTKWPSEKIREREGHHDEDIKATRKNENGGNARNSNFDFSNKKREFSKREWPNKEKLRRRKRPYEAENNKRKKEDQASRKDKW